MESFNEALLAKQVWRLLSFPDSLVAWILKAQYYPRGSVLEAIVGYNNPSYTWRSVVSAKWVIEGGSRWRVGDGMSISVWKDKWLARAPTFKVISLNSFGDRDMKVADLLDWEGGGWNEEKVRNIFLSFEANDILAIPLAEGPTKDGIIWHYDDSGAYTTRLGYKYIRWVKGSKDKASSSSSNVNIWWKTWSLPLPPKVRMFLWRCYSGALPTKRGLAVRLKSMDCVYPVCDLFDEDEVHILWHCPAAVSTWEGMNYFFADHRFDNVVDFMSWWELILELFSVEEICKIGMICWGLCMECLEWLCV